MSAESLKVPTVAAVVVVHDVAVLTAAHTQSARLKGPALIDLHTQSGALSVQINNQQAAVCGKPTGGPNASECCCLTSHNCDAHELFVSMRVTSEESVDARFMPRMAETVRG